MPRQLKQFEWTDDAVADLKKLHAKRYSFSRIANELVATYGGHLSRCSISGKVWRAGLEARKLPQSPEQRQRSRERRINRANGVNGHNGHVVKVTEQQIPPSQFDLEIPQDQRRHSVVDLTNDMCHWPVGDPGEPDFFFCGGEGADVSIGRPYCPVHQRRAGGIRRSGPFIMRELSTRAR